MGFFGWLNNLRKKFTGQATFEEADKLYEEVKERYNRHKANYDQQVQKLTKEIDDNIQQINESKVTIKTKLFPEFADKIKLLKDTNISDNFIKEFSDIKITKIDSIKSRDFLFKIDFNEHPIKSNFQAIFTLGFYTRKKAKESLSAVQEEEARVNEEIQKMNTQLSKMNVIKTSLIQINHYFKSLIEIYEAMLLRMDNSVNFLMIKSILTAREVMREQMSIKNLTLVQQKELEAIVSCTKILKGIVDKQILITNADDSITSIKDELNKQHEELNKRYLAA